MIDESVAIIRAQRDRLRKARDRLVGAAERMQRIAAIVQRLGIIRLERQRLLVAGERLLVAFQHRQHHAVTAMRRRGPRVGGKRGADQLERGGRLAALMHQHAVEVQRVEMAGLGGDDFAVERFGLGQLAATMMRARAPQQLGGVSGRGLRFGHRRFVAGAATQTAMPPESNARLHPLRRHGIGIGPMSLGTL